MGGGRLNDRVIGWLEWKDDGTKGRKEECDLSGRGRPCGWSPERSGMEKR